MTRVLQAVYGVALGICIAAMGGVFLGAGVTLVGGLLLTAGVITACVFLLFYDVDEVRR